MNSPTANSQAKKQLRRQYRAARQAIPGTARKAFNQAIVRQLLESPVTTESQTIAAYWPFDGEPDIRPALEHWLEVGKTLLLPITSQADQVMVMHRFIGAGSLSRNAFGFLQPEVADPVEPGQIDALLMPLVAFTHSGTRLGMGAGYYDRYLSDTEFEHGPHRIGIAYQVQCTENLPRDPWDQPLHTIVTEQGWFPVNTPA